MTTSSPTSTAPPFVVERLTAAVARGQIPALAAILEDVVDGGASEVMKVMVPRTARRQGIGRVGYRHAGVIPCYPRSADGRLPATAFYYRLLDATESERGVSAIAGRRA